MLVLFESPAGYAIFKLLDEKKLQETENLYKDFESSETASKVVKLKHFQKFQDMTEALSAATAAVEGKMSKGLKKLLKKLVAKEAQESLAVADAKLGNVIKEKLNVSCVYNSAIQELIRCIRMQIDNLIVGLPQKEITAMALGLAHSLSRYKLKFSPDKIDTMIIQAVSLLDDLDKELNNYIMRSKEWYGWHFPELSKIITDNNQYVRTVLAMGLRSNAAGCDMSEFLPEELEEKVKEISEVSMGTEVTEEDIMNIKHLCNEVLEMQNYRTQLYEYLKNRMMAIAPNLTVLVGELVGARLIAHAGSLLNLAKHPASTVQILGAEKAFFRAIKTKHDTPKYGLIYHAQLIGQSNPKLKGKMSRMLAAKASLATRVDALGEDGSQELGIEHRAKLETRLKQLEEGGFRKISGTGKARAKWEKYESKSEIYQYKPGLDSTVPTIGQKRKIGEIGVESPFQPKKIKVEVKEDSGEPEVQEAETSEKKKKKKKKREKTEVGPDVSQETEEVDQPKKEKIKPEVEEHKDVKQEVGEGSSVVEKKKKKKKKKENE